MADFIIGRQQIFDKDLNVYAYELLFRGKDFDLTINQSSLEPNVQVVMYLKVKYLPTVTPKIEVSSETKPK